MNPTTDQIADRRLRALHIAGRFVLPNPWDVGRPDLDDTIARLHVCAAGLYAPGLTTREQIAAVVAAVAPKPVSLLIGTSSPFTLAEIPALGVCRIEAHAERR